MKKSVGAHLLFIVLLFALITSAYASVTMQAVIDQDICVTFDFKNMNSTIYWMIKNGSLITESTIPNIILENLEQQGLNVDYYLPELLDFNDTARSIHVTFCLYGSDILNFTVNTKSTRRTYYVRTDWRQFQFDVAGISLDFNEYFGEPVSEWNFENITRPTFYYNYTGPSPFDPLCYFILPSAATKVQAVGDIIIFDLPMPLEDSLLNSPFLILGTIIVVIIASSLYRKARK